MRGPFEAALWAYPDHKNYVSVEQVWFPGVHSNVGGGYEDRRLSDIPLRWMLDRIETKGLGLKLYDDRPPIEGDPIGTLYESRTAWYALSRWRPKIRIINQWKPPKEGLIRFGGLPPHANPIAEMLHWSVLARWRESPRLENKVGEYRPINVAAALPTIYGRDLRFPTHVVGPENKPLDWVRSDNDFEFLKDLLPSEHGPPFAAERSRRQGEQL